MRTGPTVDTINLTPKLAAHFLENQAPNRAPKSVKIAQYARDMAAGRWRFTGEALKFDDDGRMLDGQNRCHAVIKSGATIRVLRVRDLDTRTQEVMDSGAPRNARDALTFAGYPNTKDIAAAVSAHVAWKAGAFGHCMANVDGSARPSNSETVAYAAAHPEIVEAAQQAKKIYTRGLRLPVGAIAVVMVETAAIDFEESAEFFDRIADLRTGGTGDPINTLLKRINGYRDYGHKIPLPMALYLLFRTWNAYRAGEQLTKFQVGAPAREGTRATWAKIPEPK